MPKVKGMSKRRQRAVFASMKTKGKLYKRSCKTGRRAKPNGHASTSHDYTAGTCSKRSHHSKVKAAKRRLNEHDKRR